MSHHDLVIIGGGPAGLTAGIYTSRAQVDTLLLEKGVPGGQLNETTDVENFPGFREPIQGPELMSRMADQAERFGLQTKMAEVQDVEFATAPKGKHRLITDEGEFTASSIIIATGASAIHLPAEGAERLAGYGVSYCATCDGFFFQDKILMMVGAGDSGLTEALFLTRFAKELRLVIRHTEDDPHAIRAKDKILRDKVLNHPKIKIQWNTVVKEILGKDKVDGIILEDVASGAAIPHDDVDGIFIAIGHKPNTDFLIEKLAMDDHGYIITDMRTRTEVPGVYAIGDVRQFSGSYAQAVIAAGDGCIAAIEAQRYLENAIWMEDELSRQVLHLASLVPQG